MRKILIKGKVFSGLGQGAFFTQLDWVKKQCEEKLNFVPSPGTLNLNVAGESLEAIDKLKEGKGVALVPPTAEFCEATCYPVLIRSVRAAIIVPQAEHFTTDVHPPEVLEVIAPVNIKDVLSVRDGDELTLEVEAG